MILYHVALLLATSTVGLLTPSSLNGVTAASIALASSKPEQALSPLTETLALENVPTPAERPVLKLESAGKAVIELQRQLKGLGYYDGAIDGQFGEKTQAAVMAFQAKIGLTTDGIVGASTWRNLLAGQSFAEFTPSIALSPLLSTLVFERTSVVIAIQPRAPASAPWLLFLMPVIPLTGGGLFYLYRRLSQTYRTQQRRALRNGSQKPLKLIHWIEYFPLIGLLIVGLTTFIAYIYVRERLVQPTLGRLENAALLKEAELAHWFEHQRRGVLEAAEALQTLSHIDILLSQQNVAISAYQEAYDGLSSYLSRLNTFAASDPDLAILTNGGIVIFSTDKNREGQYQPLQNTTTYFTRQQADQAVPNFYTSPITNELLITFATPLLNQAGRRVGVLAVNLDLAELDLKIRQPIILNQSEANYLGETGETYLVGKSSWVKSEFVSAEKARNEAFVEGVSSRGIDSAIREMSGSGLYLNYAKQPVIGVYRWAEKQNLALLLEVSQAEVFRPVHKLTRLIFASGLVIVSLLSLGLKTFRNRLLRSSDDNPISCCNVTSKELSTKPTHEQGDRE